jgi:hypothetical protein
MAAVFLLFSFAEDVGGRLRVSGFSEFAWWNRPRSLRSRRALMRNALKFVDGFFNFLVGILLVAFTPERQVATRARTIAIRVPKEPSIHS